MIFTIQTNDEVSGLDITNLLNFAHIAHTILSKQNDESVQQIVHQTLPTARSISVACPKCGTFIYAPPMSKK